MLAMFVIASFENQSFLIRVIWDTILRDYLSLHPEPFDFSVFGSVLTISEAVYALNSPALLNLPCILSVDHSRFSFAHIK